ncbi:hypothetical protein F383_37486 [Gossypium arboreum]|uniref:Uncharacterized protein n=1 Tax=Gossypium arboreum TaxID=29729 RepID=A0A0B0MBR2_GOSAR|nr:hypothetical protein F383_37486 [Gossypium arboreum]
MLSYMRTHIRNPMS